MNIFRSVFTEFEFAFTIPFTFMKIRKALRLVERISATGCLKLS